MGAHTKQEISPPPKKKKPDKHQSRERKPGQFLFFQLTSSSSHYESRGGLTQTGKSGTDSQRCHPAVLRLDRTRPPCVPHGLLALAFTVHRAAHSTMHSPLPLRHSPQSSHPGSLGLGITHRASNIGRVVHTRGPLVCAITVCSDESVLLSISRTAVDLVFPAWLRRTFYP